MRTKSSRQIAKSDYAWAIGAQALNIAAGLILLPVVLRYFTTEEIGIYFVFLALVGLGQLVELGFQPMILRSAAYVYAGAQSVGATGVPVRPVASHAVDTRLLAGLLAASRRIYRRIGGLAVLAMLGGGTAYVLTLELQEEGRIAILMAWLLFAAGYLVTLFFGYFTALLQGRGDITVANKTSIVSRALFLVLGAIGAVAGFGLAGLGIASVLAGVVGRYVSYRCVFSEPAMRAARNIDLTPGASKAFIAALWPNSWRLGAVQVGSFLLQRAGVLIASSALGLTAAATYGITVTIFGVLLNMSLVMCQLRLPGLSAMHLTGTTEAVAGIYGRILIETWGAFCLGTLVLITIGPQFLDWLGSSTTLLPAPYLALLAIVLLLELNHGVAASFLTTYNKVPFVWAALLSGTLVTIASVLTVERFGVLGLILSQGVVQLFYNNWKWPVEALRELGIGFGKVLRLGFAQIVVRTDG